MASIKDELKKLYKKRSGGEESKGFNIAEIVKELTEVEPDESTTEEGGE